MADNILAGPAYFFTGTDTGVGKTSVCLAIMEVLKRRGYRVAAMKPVASGGTITGSGVLNHDARQMMEHTNIPHDYRTINPYSLSLPAAPVIAAKRDHLKIEAGPILDGYDRLSESADVVLVEGVGGWHVQLSESLWMEDLVKLLHLPVIMVAGIRLGCINHAILTAEAISRADCRLYGWIGNQIDRDYQNSQETLALLSESIEAPMLAAIPYLSQFDIRQVMSFLADLRMPEL